MPADWLMSPAPISARCLIGRAGSGKTRLALQLCERAEALTPEWDAGFAEHRELERFRRVAEPERLGLAAPHADRGRLRGGYHPLTAAVAGGAGAEHRLWRRHLAAAAPAGALRRPDTGWWGELTRTGWSDAGIPDLFDPPQPEPLPPIGVLDRTKLVRAVMCKARPAAAGGADADAARVERLAEQATEALDALMAGLTVSTASGPVPEGRPASRVEMASALAGHECRRISTIASDRSADPWCSCISRRWRH